MKQFTSHGRTKLATTAPGSASGIEARRRQLTAGLAGDNYEQRLQALSAVAAAFPSRFEPPGWPVYPGGDLNGEDDQVIWLLVCDAGIDSDRCPDRTELYPELLRHYGLRTE